MKVQRICERECEEEEDLRRGIFKESKGNSIKVFGQPCSSHWSFKWGWILYIQKWAHRSGMWEVLLPSQNFLECQIVCF